MFPLGTDSVGARSSCFSLQSEEDTFNFGKNFMDSGFFEPVFAESGIVRAGEVFQEWGGDGYIVNITVYTFH